MYVWQFQVEIEHYSPLISLPRLKCCSAELW